MAKEEMKQAHKRRSHWRCPQLLLGVVLLLAVIYVVPVTSSADASQASIPVLPKATDDMGECTAPATTAKPSFHSTVQRFLQSASVTVPSYYLLWSPGATKKFLVSSLWLAVFHAYRDMLVLRSSAILGSFWMTDLLLPLLSSACCAIQLILNVLGLGCAGFNTYLGPVRPYFLSLLGYLSLVAYPPSTVSECLMLAVRGILALLPEAVHLWNTYTTTSTTTTTTSSVKDNPWLGESRLPQAHGIQATVELIVPSMGCVACVNKINSSLQQASPRHFLAGTSWLVPEKGGKASITMWASDETELRQLISAVQDAIHAAGFPDTTVESISKTQPMMMTGGSVDVDTSIERIGRTSSETFKQYRSGIAAAVPVQIDLLVPSMSCQGCVAEVNSVAKQASKLVQSASSSLFPNDEGGQASILVAASSKQELDFVIQEVNKALEVNGFDGNELQSVKLAVEFITAELTWAVPSMSCEACIRTINAAIHKVVPGGHSATAISKLGEQGGSTTVTVRHVSSLQELDSIAVLMEASLQDEGYGEGLSRGTWSWEVEPPEESNGDANSVSEARS